MKYMCSLAGVELGRPVGDARNSTSITSGEMYSHVWNFVKINGDIYFIDATWGNRNRYEGGAFEQRPFSTSYLFVKPEFMKRSHHPDKDLYQFIDDPLSISQMLAEPDYRGISLMLSHFYDYNLTLQEPMDDEYVIGDTAVEVKINTTDPVSLSFSLRDLDDESVSGYTTFTENTGVYTLTIDPSLPAGYYKGNIFAGGDWISQLYIRK
ncbi:hypothetical protein ACFL20_07025 [Spirochaetota bacterium]